MPTLEAFFIDDVIKDCKRRGFLSSFKANTFVSILHVKTASTCQHLASPVWTWAPWVSQQRRGERPAWVRCCSGTASAANPLLGAAHGKSTAYYTHCANESMVLHWQN